MTDRRKVDRLLPPAEAARVLGVNTRTLTRWADNNLIPVIVLPSGHRRYRPKDIAAIRQPKASA